MTGSHETADFRRWRENVRSFVRTHVAEARRLPALTGWVSRGNGPALAAAIDLTQIPPGGDNTDVQRLVLEAITDYGSRYAAVGAALVTAGALNTAATDLLNRGRERREVLGELRRASRDFGLSVLAPDRREDWEVHLELNGKLGAWRPSDYSLDGADFIVAALEARA